ncbi:hypothetical protein CR513_19565, partial [Mucuna pruriens]
MVHSALVRRLIDRGGAGLEFGKPEPSLVNHRHSTMAIVVEGECRDYAFVRVDHASSSGINLHPNLVVSNFQELEQMENNDQTLKELTTSDVVYQPWCIQYPSNFSNS